MQYSFQTKKSWIKFNRPIPMISVKPTFSLCVMLYIDIYMAVP